MRKKAITLALPLVIFVSLVAGMHGVEVTKANFFPSSVIHVISPTNTTYKSNTVILNCCVVFSVTQNKLATYSLDGGADVTIIDKQGLEPYVAAEEIWSDIVLSDLAEGSHHLEIYSENLKPGYAEVYFSIGTSPEPTPTSDPNFIFYIGIALLIIVCVVAVFLLVRKHKHQTGSLIQNQGA